MIIIALNIVSYTQRQIKVATVVAQMYTSIFSQPIDSHGISTTMENSWLALQRYVLIAHSKVTHNEHQHTHTRNRTVAAIQNGGNEVYDIKCVCCPLSAAPPCVA